MIARIVDCFGFKVGMLAGVFIAMNLPSGMAVAEGEGLTEDDVFGDIPFVTGTSHFEQRILDAPTSVSIIDRKMIDASGAVEIVEVFRMVPGFQVYFPHTGRAAINYHGFPQEYSYRMEVKIDGHSVYEPAENAVLWSTLPIELDDVDYIEVLILQKLLRVKQIEDNHGKTLVSEGLEANYLDMINYSVFALIKFMETQESKA